MISPSWRTSVVFEGERPHQIVTGSSISHSFRADEYFEGKLSDEFEKATRGSSTRFTRRCVLGAMRVRDDTVQENGGGF